MSDTKMSVSNGDFTSVEQKKMVMKKMISGFIHKGFNISSTADALGITRQTIHNYMNEDNEFRQMVESGLIEDVAQKSMVKLTHKALIEDSETAQKYLLDKSGYWEKRKDTIKETTANNVIDVILPSDVQNVANSLLGDFDIDLTDPTEDQLQKVLRAKDPTLNKDDKNKETIEDEGVQTQT